MKMNMILMKLRLINGNKNLLMEWEMKYIQ